MFNVIFVHNSVWQASPNIPFISQWLDLLLLINTFAFYLENNCQQIWIFPFFEMLEHLRLLSPIRLLLLLFFSFNLLCLSSHIWGLNVHRSGQQTRKGLPFPLPSIIPSIFTLSSFSLPSTLFVSSAPPFLAIAFFLFISPVFTLPPSLYPQQIFLFTTYSFHLSAYLSFCLCSFYSLFPGILWVIYRSWFLLLRSMIFLFLFFLYFQYISFVSGFSALS